MLMDDLMGYEFKRVDSVKYKNDAMAKKVINEYLKKNNLYFDVYKLPFYSLHHLINGYYYLKKIGKEKELDEILQKCNFNYAFSIRNAIYDLFLLEKDKRRYRSVKPTLWPGVINVENDGPLFKVDTVLGTINVYKASEVIANKIFNQNLCGRCFEVSEEYVTENPEYKVVLSYMPYAFIGGDYHAYLRRDSEVLDLAANALFTDSSTDLLYPRCPIKELSLDEMNSTYEDLKIQDSEVEDDYKLHVLAIHYDRLRHQ